MTHDVCNLFVKSSSQISQQKAAMVDEMNGEILRNGGSIFVDTFGSRMMPLMVPGSIVRVLGCTIENLRFGDVVLLKTDNEKNGSFLVHRIIKIQNNLGKISLRTKGDSSVKDLQLFDESACLGKAEYVVTSDSEFTLTKWLWRPINIVAAILSYFNTIVLVTRILIGAKKNLSRQILVQRLSSSLLKRIVRMGIRFSTIRKTDLQAF